MKPPFVALIWETLKRPRAHMIRKPPHHFRLTDAQVRGGLPPGQDYQTYLSNMIAAEFQVADNP
jgi:hypothetical protein